MGRDRLHARAGRGDPDGRMGERSLRNQAPVPGHHRALHARIDGVRGRPEPPGTGRLPGAAGTRWRNAHADRHDHHHASGRAPEHGTGHGDLRDPDAARARGRARARRLVRAGLLVAADLLRQRPHRPDRVRVRLAVPHRVAKGARAAAGHIRPPHRAAGGRGGDVRRRPEHRAGLGIVAGHQPSRRCRGVCSQPSCCRNWAGGARQRC